MSTPEINMLTEQQLAELLEIRKQMSELQARYDKIVKSAPDTSASQSAASVLSVTPESNREPSPADTTPAAPAPTAPHPPEKPKSLSNAAPNATSAASVPGPVQLSSPESSVVTPRPPDTASSPGSQSTPALEEQKPIKVDGSITSNVRQMLVTILTEAAKPLPFNVIYSRLENSGIELPASKPKLVVRKLLHNKGLFDVAPGGLFKIKDDLQAQSPETTPFVPPENKTHQPAPAAPVKASAPPPVSPAPAAPPSPAPDAPAAIPTQANTPQPVQVPHADSENSQKPASSFSSKLDAILNQ